MLSEKQNKQLDELALWLASIGALNWGLDMWGYNLVEMILGMGSLAGWVYGVVGLSGLWLLLRKLKMM